MFFSINETAEIFGVDRGTVLGWTRRDCPRIDPAGPGKPAQLSFKEVLAWRRARLAKVRWDEEGIDKMEAETRERLKAFKTRKRACK